MTTFFDVKTVIALNKKDYIGKLTTIDRTKLGYEDHGIFTAMLGCDMGGSYVTAGGWGLDSPRRDDNDDFIGRFGTAFGMQFIIELMKVFGVENWEGIKGRQIYTLFNIDDPYGSPQGFAHTRDSTKFFIFQDFFDEYLKNKEI